MVDVDDVRLQMEAIWHIFMLLILIQLPIPFYFSFSSSHYHWLVPHVTPYTHGPSSISPFLYFILNFRVFYARSLFLVVFLLSFILKTILFFYFFHVIFFYIFIFFPHPIYHISYSSLFRFHLSSIHHFIPPWSDRRRTIILSKLVTCLIWGQTFLKLKILFCDF